MSLEDFTEVFLVLADLCQMVSLPQTLPHRGKGLSLLASGGTIFTAYLLQLEIFPVGKAKKFLTLNLHVLVGASTHLGVVNSHPVPGVPWGALLPCGVGRCDAVGMVPRHRALLLGTFWTAAPAVLGVIASAHPCSRSMETIWQLEKSFFTKILI